LFNLPPHHHLILIIGIKKKKVDNSEIFLTDFESTTSETGINSKVFYHISQQTLYSDDDLHAKSFRNQQEHCTDSE